MKTSPKVKKEKVAALLDPQYHTLRQFRQRVLDLQAFVAELDRVTQKKTFLVWDHFAWRMLLDTRDMLVIQLGSWVKGATQDAGFLKQLQAHHRQALPREPWPNKLRGHRRAHHEQSHADAFGRLFPGVSVKCPSAENLGTLMDTFRSIGEPALDDRHRNRAHPFDKDGDKRKRGEVKMLDLGEIGDILDYAENLLSDLHLVGGGSRLLFPENSVMANVEDIVDLLLFGGLARQRLFMKDRSREQSYEDLHEEHGDRDPHEPPWFNEPPLRE
jgi:hypothetical protein